MPKVALVGCGLVADQHMSQIRRVTGSEIVAVCDQEPLMAQQLADRFKVPQFFVDLGEMLKNAKPEIVHITTPAQSHFPIAKACIEAGCHVYVEKPFTVNVAEAEELIALAKSKGRLLTAGHNLQFSPEAIRMREMVASGFLGGPPIHIDCMQLFTHAEPNYGTAVLGDVDHWVRSLPGSLLHNLISHGLAKIVEFLPGDNPRVLTHAFPSPYIRNVAQMEIVDELRTVIYGDNDVTAQFIFSTRLGAATNQLRLYGKDATLVVDSTNRTVIPIRPASYKSYLRYFLVPRIFAREYRRNSWDNMKQFLHARFHSDYGMWMLTRKFYEATKGACEIPISYREILNTAKIMDAIFSVLPRKA